MKAQVTDQGVIIPSNFFIGIKEVEILKEKNRILIIPVKNVSFIKKEKKNNIMKLAGIIEDGHLAENIDGELYGNIR